MSDLWSYKQEKFDYDYCPKNCDICPKGDDEEEGDGE